jgi:hypothetical protein
MRIASTVHNMGEVCFLCLGSAAAALSSPVLESYENPCVDHSQMTSWLQKFGVTGRIDWDEREYRRAC